MLLKQNKLILYHKEADCHTTYQIPISFNSSTVTGTFCSNLFGAFWSLHSPSGINHASGHSLLGAWSILPVLTFLFAGLVASSVILLWSIMVYQSNKREREISLGFVVWSFRNNRYLCPTYAHKRYLAGRRIGLLPWFHRSWDIRSDGKPVDCCSLPYSHKYYDNNNGKRFLLCRISHPIGTNLLGLMSRSFIHFNKVGLFSKHHHYRMIT